MVFFLFFPKELKALLFDLRIPRILHYYIHFLFGIVLFYQDFFQFQHFIHNNFNKLLAYLIVLTYSAIFAIISNNIVDFEIDTISNPFRPHIQKQISSSLYLKTGVFCLIWALILSYSINWIFFISIFLLSLVYYLYSCPPFRFKRIVIFSKWLIGLNSWITILTGWMIAGGKLQDFPVFWSIFVLIPISLVANFVDLKDKAGDEAAGIQTFPVLWGEKRTKQLISVFLLFAYMMTGFYFPFVEVIILLLLVYSFHIWILWKEPYQEIWLFLLHNGLYIGLSALIFYKTYTLSMK